MTDADRVKWNEKFRDGAYAGRTHPSALLTGWVDRIPRGRALDVACGAGRNALYLAGEGFEVDAVDIAREGLERGRRKAREQGLEINWIEHDLDEPLEPGARYTLILVIRYLDLSLVRDLRDLLAPGGFLVCEVHLRTDAATRGEVAGPSSPQFRAQPGALLKAVDGLQIHHYHEGLIEDPDGRAVAVAQVVAQRPE